MNQSTLLRSTQGLRISECKKVAKKERKRKKTDHHGVAGERKTMSVERCGVFAALSPVPCLYPQLCRCTASALENVRCLCKGDSLHIHITCPGEVLVSLEERKRKRSCRREERERELGKSMREQKREDIRKSEWEGEKEGERKKKRIEKDRKREEDERERKKKEK